MTYIQDIYQRAWYMKFHRRYSVTLSQFVFLSIIVNLFKPYRSEELTCTKLSWAKRKWHYGGTAFICLRSRYLRIDCELIPTLWRSIEHWTKWKKTKSHAIDNVKEKASATTHKHTTDHSDRDDGKPHETAKWSLEEVKDYDQPTRDLVTLSSIVHLHALLHLLSISIIPTGRAAFSS